MKIQTRPPIDLMIGHIMKKLLEISNLTTSKRLEALTLVQSDQVNKAVDRILALLYGVVD